MGDPGNTRIEKCYVSREILSENQIKIILATWLIRHGNFDKNYYEKNPKISQKFENFTRTRELFKI